MIDRGLLEAFSRGEVTRRELSERSGVIVGFGDVLAQLHEHHLPLPRIGADMDMRGVQLIRQLTERAMQRAG
jgi:hypothetical protein